MKKLLFILMVSFAMSGCDPESPKLGGGPVYVYLRSYIMGFYDARGIGLWQSQEGLIVVDLFPDTANADVNNHYIHYSDDRTNADDGYIGDYRSTGVEKEAYDALCEKYGDLSFNRKVRFISELPNPATFYFGYDFTSIDVTSDADYNETHKAGASLNDLITASFVSPKPYIDSGYVEYDNDPTYDLVKYSYISGKLSELSATDFVLMGGSSGGTPAPDPKRTPLIGYEDSELIALKFDTPPAVPGTYTFTVKMTVEDGRVFEDSIEVTF